MVIRSYDPEQQKNMQPTYIPVENLELCFEVSEDQPEVGHLT